MEPEELAARLAENPVFRHLQPEERYFLADRAQALTLNKGMVLGHQGQVWPRAAYLGDAAGQWCLLAPSGKRQVVFRLGPGAVVWGHSLFDGQPLPASFEIVEPGTVYCWPGEVLLPVLLRRPEALWALVGEMVGWMRRVRETIYSLAFQAVLHRVARVLLQAYPAAEGLRVPRSLTLDEMAAMVGTSREFVSRVLQHLDREGIVRVGRRYLVFTDRQRLEQLAQGD